LQSLDKEDPNLLVSVSKSEKDLLLAMILYFRQISAIGILPDCLLEAEIYTQAEKRRLMPR